MSKRFNYDDSNKSFLYTGYEGYTTEPDSVYCDKGTVFYLDGVRTGYKFESECKIYFDLSLIKNEYVKEDMDRLYGGVME